MAIATHLTLLMRQYFHGIFMSNPKFFKVSDSGLRIFPLFSDKTA